MRQNRRRYAKTSSFNHRAIVLASMLVLIFVGSSLMILAVKGASAKIGRDIVRLERELNAIHAEKVRAEARWSECAKPEQLEAALARHGLNMTLAKGERIVSLIGTKPSGAFTTGTSEVAANGSKRR